MFPLIIDSAAVAGMYSLSALSWVLLYRSTRLLNLANGQLLLLGTYLFFTFVTTLGLPVPVALLASLAAIGVIGIVTYYAVLRRMVGQAEFAIVVMTLGLAAVVTSITTPIWGNADRVLPPLFTTHVYDLPLGAHITNLSILVLVLAIIVVVAAAVCLDHLHIGLAMRAAAESPVLAGQTGIRVGRVLAVGWALSLIAATLSGIAYSYTNVLSPDISEQLGLLGLAPAFIGGLDSIPGVLAGGLIVALAQTFAGAYISASSQEAVAWVLMLVFLLLRPQGLFGTANIERV